jgi:hypothetical protein
MKTQRDIEKLVSWAMREELPKGRAVSTSAWELLTRYGQLGTRVDGGGWRDDLGYVPGEPHADAVTIGAMLRSMQTEARFAHHLDARELFGDIAPIAGDAVDAMTRATFNPQALVISHAVQSTRPKWQFCTPAPARQFVPTAGRSRALVHGTDRDGLIVYLEPRRGRAAMRDGLYDLAMTPRSPLIWCDPAPISIAEARAEYLCWFDALADLIERLRGALIEFEPVMPQLARMPWITGQVPQPRVLWAKELLQDWPATSAGDTTARPPRRRISDVYDRRRQGRALA